MPNGDISAPEINMGNPESSRRTGVGRLEPEKKIIGRVKRLIGPQAAGPGGGPGTEPAPHQASEEELREARERVQRALSFKTIEGMNYNVLTEVQLNCDRRFKLINDSLVHELFDRAKKLATVSDVYHIYNQGTASEIIKACIDEKLPEADKEEQARLMSLFLTPEEGLKTGEKEQINKIKDLYYSSQSQQRQLNEEESKTLRFVQPLFNHLEKSDSWWAATLKIARAADKTSMLFLTYDELYAHYAKNSEALTKLGLLPPAYDYNTEFLGFILEDLPGVRNNFEIVKEVVDPETGNKVERLEKIRWPTLSKQIDKTMRLYYYLAVQSDKRRNGKLKHDPNEISELEELRVTRGFREKLFGSLEEEEKWLGELKLKSLASSEGALKPYKDYKYEDLPDGIKDILKEKEAPNIFAQHLSADAIRAVNESVYQFLRGEEYSPKNSVMNDQMELARYFAEKLSHYFGIAAYYGSHATDFDKDGNPTGMEFEEEVWSDSLCTAINLGDKIIYVFQDSGDGGGQYWIGPRYFREHLGEYGAKSLFIDFLRFAKCTKPGGNPNNKLDIRSANELWWEEGRSLGEIFKNYVNNERALQRWLLRLEFLFKEKSGVVTAMIMKDLADKSERGDQENVTLFEDIKKSIYVVNRDYLQTRGEWRKFALAHEGEINKRAREIIGKGKTTLEDAKKNGFSSVEEYARSKAFGDKIGGEIYNSRKQWRELIINSIIDWHTRDRFGVKLDSETGRNYEDRINKAAIKANFINLEKSPKNPLIQSS